MKYKFIKGIELNRGFYFDVVKPIIESEFPELKYSAALVGYGSDVLGYDTEISMDHGWGPRCRIFIMEEYDETFDSIKEKLNQVLQERLPQKYKGFPTKYTKPSEVDGVVHMAERDEDTCSHLISVHTIRNFIYWTAGHDPDKKELQLFDWLAFSEQGLLELTKGEVFHDDLGIEKFRKQFTYFPEDVRLLKLSAVWDHIANEEAFVGRRLDLGDSIGAKTIAVRIANTLMKICFYLEEKYIPYSKWFMTAFKELSVYEQLIEPIEEIVLSNSTNDLDLKVARLAKAVAEIQNAELGMNLEIEVTGFYGRPYKCIFCENIVKSLRERIKDENLKQINIRKIGIEQKIDGIDFLGEGIEILQNIIRGNKET